MSKGEQVMDKLLGKKVIKKLDINLMDKTDEDFRKARLKYIKDWVGAGKKKEWAEADFDEKYPDKRTWNANVGATLNSLGEQVLIDKINEIVEVVNNL